MTHQSGDLPAKQHSLTGGVSGKDILTARITEVMGLAALMRLRSMMCFRTVHLRSVYDSDGDCIMLLPRLAALTTTLSLCCIAHAAPTRYPLPK